jgi:hypothetical protein
MSDDDESLISYSSAGEFEHAAAARPGAAPSAMQRLAPWAAGLSDGLADCGMERPSTLQEKVIPQLLAGIDAIIEDKAGQGKTTAHVLVALQRLATPHQWCQARHREFPPAMRAQVRTVLTCSLRAESPLALLPHALRIAVLECLESRLDGTFLALAPTRESAAATYAAFERLSRHMEECHLGWAHPSTRPGAHRQSAAALATSSARAQLDAHKRDAGPSGPPPAAAATGAAASGATPPNIVVGTTTSVRDALRDGALRLPRLRMVAFDEIWTGWTFTDLQSEKRGALLEALGAEKAEVQRVMIANPCPCPVVQALLIRKERSWGNFVGQAHAYQGKRAGWTLMPPMAAAAGEEGG